MLRYQNSFDPDFIRKTILKNNLKGLQILEFTESTKLESLESISKLTFLENLGFASSFHHDFSFLSNLVNLKWLSISAPKYSNLDVSNFKKLESLSTDWCAKGISGLIDCPKLRKLQIWRYNERNLLPLGILDYLTSLDIRTSSLQALEGINNFKSLKYLALGNCPKLLSIAGVSCLSDLDAIRINSCKKITSYQDLQTLENLKSIELIDCGDVRDFNSIFEMKRLNDFKALGKTTLIDYENGIDHRIRNFLYYHKGS